METGTVEEVETQVGAEEAVQQDGGEASQATPEAGASNSIDPAQYEAMQQKLSQYEQNWGKIESLANTDKAFRAELERAWRGLPPAQQAQLKKEAAQEHRQSVRQEPKTNKEIDELKQGLKQIQDTFQAQQQESLKREKFSEVQSETEAVAKRFNATEADMGEFWKRYGEMIRNEAYAFMQQRPGLPPTTAAQMAYARHDRNLAAEYINLMEDRMVDFYGKKIRERENPLRAINSPADKAGRAGAGATPNLQDRFLSTLKKEKNPEKRAEMMKAYSDQTGIPIDAFFRSSGG